MTFDDALRRMRYGGKTLTRKTWPVPACLKVEEAGFLFINMEPGYALTEADILAEDWDLVFKD